MKTNLEFIEEIRRGRVDDGDIIRWYQQSPNPWGFESSLFVECMVEDCKELNDAYALIVATFGTCFDGDYSDSDFGAMSRFRPVVALDKLELLRGYLIGHGYIKPNVPKEYFRNCLLYAYFKNITKHKEKMMRFIRFASETWFGDSRDYKVAGLKTIDKKISDISRHTEYNKCYFEVKDFFQNPHKSP